MINKSLFTSNSEDWETPQDLFDELKKEFDFQFDVCATKQNAKCEFYYSKEDDSLGLDWHRSYKGWSWMNPPYGRGIGEWIKKASKEKMVVALLPSRTDTKWFHDYIYKKKNVEIRFIKGRLKFSGSKNSAPFPSMIVIFK